MKAADVSDERFLRAVKACERGPSRWAMRYDVAAVLDVPDKIAGAKFRRVRGRGLVEGCDCGCRGDWELTVKGRAVLDTKVDA